MFAKSLEWWEMGVQESPLIQLWGASRTQAGGYASWTKQCKLCSPTTRHEQRCQHNLPDSFDVFVNSLYTSGSINTLIPRKNEWLQAKRLSFLFGLFGSDEDRTRFNQLLRWDVTGQGLCVGGYPTVSMNTPSSDV